MFLFSNLMPKWAHEKAFHTADVPAGCEHKETALEQTEEPQEKLWQRYSITAHLNQSQTSTRT